MDRDAKLAEIETLQSRLAQLEREVHDLSAADVWTPPKYYTAYELMGGMVLGLIGAGASLLFNIIGALMVGKHALELIRVYLTFPMGESALTLENGFALAAGVCLYLITGMVGGIPIHMILGRYFKESSGLVRFLAATVLGLGVWLVNFYGFLSWAQPMLIGGNWIVKLIPWYVAAATHLVFAWTMLAAHRWGEFVPYETRRRAARGVPA
ncbi:MAG: hypothetical protein H6816_02360 [Phycisphaerales bacterium]|nr:hypothetical protein [Phycisphaerales bacterium]